MDLVTPEFGLLFWMVIVFGILLVILKKKAWSPILKAVKNREEKINDALEAAEAARKEMSDLQSKNEELLNEARAERDKMLKEARETREQIIGDAKTKAKEEAERLVTDAKEAIRHEKMAAITELKNQVATLSIEIAEKIVREDLASDEKQKELATSLVDEMNLN